MPSQDLMVEVKDAFKSFPKPGKGSAVEFIPVLHGLSFGIQRAEFVSIVGPTGCGKTSVLRAIAGLLALDSGSITVNGATVKGPGRERAMVFQEPTLLPWATALDNAAFGLKQRGVGKAERHARAREALQLVGLEQRANALPHELSGGMRQRVGIARALSVNPDVLLMDEPFGALDEITRRSLQDELVRIWEHDKKTVIFITHSVEEALYLSDRILVMSHAGHIIETVSDLMPRPRTREQETTETFVNLRAKIWQALS